MIHSSGRTITFAPASAASLTDWQITFALYPVSATLIFGVTAATFTNPCLILSSFPVTFLPLLTATTLPCLLLTVRLYYFFATAALFILQNTFPLIRPHQNGMPCYRTGILPRLPLRH